MDTERKCSPFINKLVSQFAYWSSSNVYTPGNNIQLTPGHSALQTAPLSAHSSLDHLAKSYWDNMLTPIQVPLYPMAVARLNPTLHLHNHLSQPVICHSIYQQFSCS